MNTVWLEGSLVSKTKPKKLQNGGSLTKLEITPGNTDEDRIEVQFWNSACEDVIQRLKLNEEIFVIGKVKTSTWTDKETGDGRYRLVINGVEVMPVSLLKRGTDNEFRGLSNR